MTEQSKDNELLSRDLKKTTYSQFAENQNHYHNVLLQLLILLGSVILGFGYVLHDQSYTKSEVLIVFLVAEFLLVFGVALICSIAYGFRRDQTINYKIRQKAGLIGKNSKDISFEHIFHWTYNPYHLLNDKNKLNWFNWLPEFYKVFIVTFIVFQLLLNFAFEVAIITFDRYIVISCIGILLIAFEIILWYARKLEIFLRESRDC